MVTVTLLPNAAAERICHDEQMRIWANDFAGALSACGYLRNDIDYSDGVDLQETIRRELRRVIEMALDHPEARTVMTVSRLPQERS